MLDNRSLQGLLLSLLPDKRLRSFVYRKEFWPTITMRRDRLTFEWALNVDYDGDDSPSRTLTKVYCLRFDHLLFLLSGKGWQRNLILKGLYLPSKTIYSLAELEFLRMIEDYDRAVGIAEPTYPDEVALAQAVVLLTNPDAYGESEPLELV